MKRVFLIVLDSVGAGEAPDAAAFGDVGAHTLGSVSKSPKLDIPNLIAAGLGNIAGLDFLGTTDSQYAAVAKMTEKSAGKDTTIGHWEIAGLISEKPLPTYKNGFPPEIIEKFEKAIGKGILCNLPYSGTEVLRDYGDEHMRTGKPIVYTSADSVFQIAAHEEIIPVETLYEYCKIARKILVGKDAVGRVIARPFIGSNGNFTRTERRHDFSLEPTGTTLLDVLSAAGKDVISVGKISDIFAGRGITKAVPAHNNTESTDATESLLSEKFDGLCFINLVDFDMVYGHRNNVDGYAEALTAFDRRLPALVAGLSDDDVMMITADHGCDPGDISTDHTREYTPLLVIGKKIKPVNLGIRTSFADIAATVAEMLGVPFKTDGISFYSEVVK